MSEIYLIKSRNKNYSHSSVHLEKLNQFKYLLMKYHKKIEDLHLYNLIKWKMHYQQLIIMIRHSLWIE